MGEEVEYLIVIAKTIYQLQDQVNDLIGEGYQPIGGITYKPKIPQSYGEEYYQAMFKPENEDYGKGGI